MEKSLFQKIGENRGIFPKKIGEVLEKCKNFEKKVQFAFKSEGVDVSNTLDTKRGKNKLLEALK